MRKSTLARIFAVIMVIAWVIFCAVIIPQEQKKNREQEVKYLRQIQDEHDMYYIDIVDSDGNVHSIPKEEYEAAHQEEIMEDAELTAYIEEATAKWESEETTVEEITEDPYTRYTNFSKDYCSEDLTLLAQVIESEAGIESYYCKLCVASVVLNRCASEDFPNSLQQVIWQKDNGVYQFSVTIPREDGSRAIDCEPSDDSWEAARDILDNGSIVPLGVLYFYSTSCDSNWLGTRETYTTIDHTIFAYYWRK